MNRTLGILLLSVLVVLSGCSAMSKKDCLSTDWYGAGLQDGRNGYAADRVATYVVACEKHDVSVNSQEYQRGNQAGLVDYCQPDNGYRVGLSGRALPRVCPANLATAFAASHAKGYVQFQIDRDISEAKSGMVRTATRLSELDDSRLQARAELAAASSTALKSSAQADLTEVEGQLRESQDRLSLAIGRLACASANWYSAGLSDGKAGLPISQFNAHQRQCTAYHPAANSGHYSTGHGEGLAFYCSFDSGLGQGLRGVDVAPRCTGSGQRAFDAGYKQGRDQYDEKLTIATLELKQQQLTQLIPTLQEEMARVAVDQENSALSTAQKLDAGRRLNRLNQQLLRSETQLAATDNELNCYIADWQALGFAAGEQGRAFQNDSKNCRSYGLTVDEGPFEQGYEQGLVNYCSPLSGSTVGRLGQPYLDVCPAALERAFLRAYQPAFAEFQRAALRKELAQDIVEVSAELTQVQGQVDALNRDLVRVGISRSERLSLISQMAQAVNQEETLVAENEKVQAHYQCLTDNWFDLGQQHGAQGLSNQLRQLDCRRFGAVGNVTGNVAENANQYRNGLNRGLNSWCSYDNGLLWAQQGNDSSVCQRTVHRDFYRGVDAGIAEQQRQAQIDALRLEKLDLLELAPELTAQLAEVDTQLLNPSLTQRQRVKLTQEQGRLTRRQSALTTRQAEIDRALTDLGG